MKTAIFGSNEAAMHTVRTLNNSNNEVELVTSSKIHIDGIDVISADMMRGKYDLIILTEDADNKALAWQIGQFLKTDGKIITLQPSSPETELINYFGNEKVAFGIYDDNKILFQKSICAEAIAPLLSADLSDNVLKKRFEAMGEAAFGGICSVAGCSMVMITSNDTWMDIMANTVKEFTAICAEEQVYDIAINGYLPADLLTMKGFFKKRYPSKKIIAAIPDYSEKTPINEFESITSYADKNGISAPLCKKMLSLLKKINAGELKRGPQNITLFK